MKFRSFVRPFKKEKNFKPPKIQLKTWFIKFQSKIGKKYSVFCCFRQKRNGNLYVFCGHFWKFNTFFKVYLEIFISKRCFSTIFLSNFIPYSDLFWQNCRCKHFLFHTSKPFSEKHLFSRYLYVKERLCSESPFLLGF